MRKFIVVSALILMMSTFIFGFNIELGAGANDFIFPTVDAGINVPIAGNFSLTGQFSAFWVPVINYPPTFMALGGGRYTVDMKNMKLFIGADVGAGGGLLPNFLGGTVVYPGRPTFGGSAMFPVFEFNGGVLFQKLYIKGAMRWGSKSVNTGESLENELVPLFELTGGFNWAF